MFLFFEDWSEPMFMSALDEKGIPHGDRIIKVMASDKNPRESLRPEIAVFESDDGPLTTEAFRYPDRGVFTGSELEERLAKSGINDTSVRIVRALFRFANRKDVQSCQEAMSIKNDRGEWVISNPLEDIDGIEAAALGDPRRVTCIHLDIFRLDTIRRLRRLVDIDDKNQLVNKREGRTFRGETEITHQRMDQLRRR